MRLVDGRRAGEAPRRGEDPARPRGPGRRRPRRWRATPSPRPRPARSSTQRHRRDRRPAGRGGARGRGAGRRRRAGPRPQRRARPRRRGRRPASTRPAAWSRWPPTCRRCVRSTSRGRSPPPTASTGLCRRRRRATAPSCSLAGPGVAARTRASEPAAGRRTPRPGALRPDRDLGDAVPGCGATSTPWPTSRTRSRWASARAPAASSRVRRPTPRRRRRPRCVAGTTSAPAGSAVTDDGTEVVTCPRAAASSVSGDSGPGSGCGSCGAGRNRS